MTNVFKAAHTMTKQVIQTGDNYAVTFAACLKLVYANIKADIKAHYKQLEAVKALYAAKGLALVLSEVLANGVRLYNAYKADGSLFDYGVNVEKVKLPKKAKAKKMTLANFDYFVQKGAYIVLMGEGVKDCDFEAVIIDTTQNNKIIYLGSLFEAIETYNWLNS